MFEVGRTPMKIKKEAKRGGKCFSNRGHQSLYLSNQKKKQDVYILLQQIYWRKLSAREEGARARLSQASRKRTLPNRRVVEPGVFRV